MRGLFPPEPGDAAHGVVPRGRKVRIKTIRISISFFAFGSFNSLFFYFLTSQAGRSWLYY